MVNKLIVLFYLISFSTFGSQKYLLFLRDKGSQTIQDVTLTQKANDRRAKSGLSLTYSDVPLSAAYLSFLNQNGQVKKKSRWLNAVIFESTHEKSIIQSWEFVDSLVVLTSFSAKGKPATSAINDLNYGQAVEDYEMMDIPLMHNLGFTGEGVKIAVFDSGFEGVDVQEAFDNTSILGGYNFVTSDSNVYQADYHGTYVLSVIGTNSPGKLIGTAFAADFYLFVTEDVNSESLEEEFNWLVAAEKSDSLGVDIISSSLSYSTFDKPMEDHVYTDLDGRTTIISMAAQEAAQKGILVVNSAGNEGNSPWQYIAAPADADSILAVGSVDPYGNYAGFSSKGPTSDGRIKPDVVCQGVNVYVIAQNGAVTTSTGTSFSAPQVTGFSAGIMNLDSSLTNIEVIQMVKASASQYDAPDNRNGYGIPSFTSLLNNYYNDGKNGVFVRKTQVYPNPIQNQALRLFVEGVNDLGEEIKVAVYHNTGVLIYEEQLVLEEVISTLKVDMSIYNAGVYYIKVQLSNGEYTHRLIKM